MLLCIRKLDTIIAGRAGSKLMVLVCVLKIICALYVAGVCTNEILDINKLEKENVFLLGKHLSKLVIKSVTNDQNNQIIINRTPLPSQTTCHIYSWLSIYIHGLVLSIFSFGFAKTLRSTFSFWIPTLVRVSGDKSQDTLLVK